MQEFGFQLDSLRPVCTYIGDCTFMQFRLAPVSIRAGPYRVSIVTGLSGVRFSVGSRDSLQKVQTGCVAHSANCTVGA